MSANTEILLRGRTPRLPVWIVVGTALVLAGTLAVVSLSDSETSAPPREPGITVDETLAGSPDDAAEMAALKVAAFEQRRAGEVTGAITGATETVPANESIDIARLKTAVAREFQRGS